MGSLYINNENSKIRRANESINSQQILVRNQILINITKTLHTDVSAYF